MAHSINHTIYLVSWYDHYSDFEFGSFQKNQNVERSVERSSDDQVYAWVTSVVHRMKTQTPMSYSLYLPGSWT